MALKRSKSTEPVKDSETALRVVPVHVQELIADHAACAAFEAAVDIDLGYALVVYLPAVRRASYRALFPDAFEAKVLVLDLYVGFGAQLEPVHEQLVFDAGHLFSSITGTFQKGYTPLKTIDMRKWGVPFWDVPMGKHYLTIDTPLQALYSGPLLY